MNVVFLKYFFWLFALLFCSVGQAEVLPESLIQPKVIVPLLLKSPNHFIHENIAEQYPFFGLASYYNHVSYYRYNGKTLFPLKDNKTIMLKQQDWLLVVGRFKILLVKAPGVSIKIHEQKLRLTYIPLNTSITPLVILKTQLSQVALALGPELKTLRYSHLWKPLAYLSQWIEMSFVAIQSYLEINWLGVILVFSILLKILLLPISIMTVRFQRRVSQCQKILADRLTAIKASCSDPADIHHRLMAVYKELHISPFYTLKPMLGSLVQVPILIAIFNVLGEMPQLIGQPFLWGGGLAYPDAIAVLPFSIPLLGDKLSLLPFLMTAVTIFSTCVFKNSCAPVSEVRKQKRHLYLMAFAFFVLFYPFPSIMVFYWTLANILQTIQQQFLKI